MGHLKLILLQIILLLTHIVNGLDPLVETNVGLIKGIRADDGEYSMFLGIPYAKVDLDNPFGPSTPYPVFNDTFEAYDDSSKCPQFDETNKVVVGTLDCLHLNVHVPNSATTKNLLPVMVSIHAGGFMRGSGGKSQYGTKYLIRHDVLVVTFNYRPGLYGFMCLGTPEVPGNQGLKDQLIALRWVKANIKAFGGDPDRVTIVGESAGGRSVDFFLMAEDENLFNKAILQSGNSLSPLAPVTGETILENTELPIVLAGNLGFETEDFREAVSFLKTVDPTLLVGVAHNLGLVFNACVEEQLDGVEIYVPDYTINRKVPKVRITPILLGFNNNERYFVHSSKDNSYYNGLDYFGTFLKNYFTFNEEQLAEAEQLVRNFYIGDEELSVDVKQELADFDSDFTYVHPTQRRIAHYMSNGAQKIYQYMFSYDSARNHYKIANNVTVPGAIHADELGYLFDMNSLPDSPTPEDQLMIDRMTTMWTNFAKYGDPTPETSDLLPVKWEPITDSNWYYYNIDSDLTLERRPFNRRMTFLDLFFKMYGQYQNGYRITEDGINTVK
ncbi:bile salt-activated lipase-like [Epargyreus clarus]|uniref:bile salt-activated lipase-like n=1 Tax=Epargyreus clarus TaxID=520877 RepID=UPI003C301445